MDVVGSGVARFGGDKEMEGERVFVTDVPSNIDELDSMMLKTVACKAMKGRCRQVLMVRQCLRNESARGQSNAIECDVTTVEEAEGIHKR